VDVPQSYEGRILWEAFASEERLASEVA
jgi:hypothetical protein